MVTEFYQWFKTTTSNVNKLLNTPIKLEPPPPSNHPDKPDMNVRNTEPNTIFDVRIKA